MQDSGFGHLGAQLSSMAGAGGHFIYSGGLFLDKTCLRIPLGDGLQEAGSNTAVEKFWRGHFVEIWQIMWYAIYRP